MRTTAPVAIVRKGWEYVRLPFSQGEGGNNIVEINQNVQWGSPVIRGTRIPAETIARMYSAGDSVKGLCVLYRLTEEQVKACINYINAPIQGPYRRRSDA